MNYFRTNTIKNKLGRIYSFDASSKFYNEVLPYYLFETDVLNMAKELIFRHNSKPRRIIDVGANIGMNTIEYSGWAFNVDSFEPNPQLFDLLKANCLINQTLFSELDGKITLHECALGAYGHESNLTIPPRGTDGGYMDPTDNGIPIEVNSLDNVYRFDDVDFIKIDVEGREYEVLQGAIKTIRHCHPVLQIELVEVQQQRANYTCQQICNLLANIGYGMFLPNGIEVDIFNWDYTPGMDDRFFT